jgi:DNA modification methylase
LTGRLLIGDALEQLRALPAESVHCCITSPPYWGLRDYGAEGQLGLEKTPEQHVAAMVAVFEEVRRVLRSDGTLWLNYGDSYASGEIGRHDGYNPTRAGNSGTNKPFGKRQQARLTTGLKPKDLVGMPWRVAFALQAAGWYLRSDIIWHKPNPMPESVRDRPTSAHEYLFLLAKSPRYFYDADAIREQLSEVALEQLAYAQKHHFSGSGRSKLAPERGDGDSNVGAGGKHARAARGAGMNPAGRNKRSVWTVATQPYSGAHFATFPPKLITPCIMAGTSERGCCSGCGAPWVRVVGREGKPPVFAPLAITKTGVLPDGPGTHRNLGGRYQQWLDDHPRTTTGWRPSCGCGSPKPEPCTVLDPFGGSGTVAEVAEAIGRRWVLIELNPKYAELIRKRTAQQGLFSAGEVAGTAPARAKQGSLF